MIQSECARYWNLAHYFPFNDAINYWCEGDAQCGIAKSNALMSAVEDGLVKYRRADGADYPDSVYTLQRRGLLLIERDSFLEWAKSVSSRTEKDALQNTVDISVKAENTYLAIIGAMRHLILEATYSGGKRYTSINTSTDLIETLISHSPGTTGLGERTLQGKFAEAKKQFEGSRTSPQLR